MIWAWVSLAVLCFAMLCSLFLYLLGRSSVGDKTVQSVIDASPYRKDKPPTQIALNDPLARNKLYEKRRQEELEKNMGVVKYDPNQNLQVEEEAQIVGVAEPQGFWTKFIMGQKIGYIKMRMSMQSSSSSFWTTLIKAQETSRKGQDRGRGRM